MPTKVMRLASSGHQDVSIRKQDGPSFPAEVMHRTGERPGADRRVKKLGAGEEGLAETAGRENFPVAQQGRRGFLARVSAWRRSAARFRSPDRTAPSCRPNHRNPLNPPATSTFPLASETPRWPARENDKRPGGIPVLR